ncbi:MAG: PolC-type DNA polymerase III [Lachnospiraceae bacterium]|nr:PolC-type DNA polymerase III [Lachnospiraceae bacterium]
MSASRPFFEVFPGLTFKKQLSELLNYVTVDKVTVNKTKSRLRVYLTSPNWLKKKHVYTIESQIANQLFEEMEMSVTVIEKFQLSEQYTPEAFYAVYRDSMLTELKKRSPMLYQLFIHAGIYIEAGGLIRVELPKNIIAEQHGAALEEYVEKVFAERAGFSAVEVETSFLTKDMGAVHAQDENRIAERVRSVQNSNRARKEEPVEEKKLPKKEEKRYVRPKTPSNDPTVIYGRSFDGAAEKMEALGEDPHEVIVRGEVFGMETRETRTGRIICTISLTDHTDSVRMKLWFEKEEQAEFESAFKKGSCFMVNGMMDFDPYDNEMMIKSVYGIKRIPSIQTVREDTSPEKRVELHCHTKMSDMDAVSSAKDIVKQAYRFGMKALAITDHGVVQAFPEAYHTIGGKGGIPKDADFKVIYGMEAYLVDDMKALVSGELMKSIHDPVVVFSTVTTGQSPFMHDIIEIGAIRVEDGKIKEEFTSLVNPGRPIPFSIQAETGITDSMVAKSGDLKTVLTEFFAFAEGMTLVAYDADQEINFLTAAADRLGLTFRCDTWVDIPAVTRFLLPDIGKIRFERLAKYLKVPCNGTMRAFSRAQCMSLVYGKLLDEMEKLSVETFDDLNKKGTISPDRIRNLRYYHAILLAKNETGRRNLYTLVSKSHLNYYKMRPRIPRSVLNEHRDGLILGSACSAGELYAAILEGKTDAEIARIANYYDYLEIQPDGNNSYLLKDPKSGIGTIEDLQEINRKIVRLGEQFRKPVVATCDVHFLNPEDAIYRSIIQAGHGYKDVTEQPPLYLRTTDEMMKEFAYLGDEKCKEVVITNSNLIADMIENISPIYPDKCPPTIPHAEEDLEQMCYEKAKRWYGDPIPNVVKERLDKELTSIISNGYAVMYIIAQKLVKKSNDDGYLVGSRGSVGSSFAATMADITEVNPLGPHYRCLNPDCLYSDFDSEEPTQAHLDGRCGCDMPDRICPKCGQPLYKDGFDIPFETFLGFAGNKEPDIDLNFSGDEQNVAQSYTEVIFGKGQTFKAGTIGTVAEKTAYGYALHYFEDLGKTKKRCELERLSQGCVGVRRTTGQHPGGVIVLPKGMDINWFTPVQRPANDVNSPFITTHFDYHSIDTNLLKLDILGHDDPTIIRMLQDLTDTDPHDVPLDDKGVLSLFSGTEALGVTPADLDGCEMGTLGVPEFGTNFVIGMLKDTHPSTFSELIRISGLSHGTDVWLGNAQYYIENGYCTLPTSICCRDDIMLFLINKGMDKELSFKTMESVRKGKGLTPDMEKEMRAHDVPEWYIESCLKIKYMFPKAHAAAYVMNAFRIAYYKINYPLAYYAAFFSIRAKTFDYGTMCQGKERLEFEADQIRKNPNASQKEQDMFDDMKLVREMYARGYSFHRLDIYKAKALRCSIIDGKIMPSLKSVEGLGESQAIAIEEEAKKGPFLSKDDLRQRTKVSKTVIDLLDEYGVLGEMAESNQLSLFDLIS